MGHRLNETVVVVNMSKKHREAILTAASSRGMSVSAFVRSMIFEKEPEPVAPPVIVRGNPVREMIAA